MKKKALIKILAAPEDLAELRGVFDHLRRNGVVISEEKATLRKKDIVLAVLSERFYGDEELKAQLFDQLAVGAEYILPLNLADMPVPEEIMNLLFARNIIMSSGRSDEELAERILSAIPEKKNPTAAVFAAAMAILFLWHIKRIEKRISDTEAAYGKITDYRTEKTTKEYYYPVVEYETAENELISAAYTYPDKEKRYEIGDEELIHYTPDDPMFFYFADREKELTDVYYKCIIIGGFLAAIDIIAIIIILCI